MAFNNSVECLHPTLQAGVERESRGGAGLPSAGDCARRNGISGWISGSRAHAGSGAGGDVLILTDGQVAGTEQILAQARATNIRLFCLGIGSASQDRFLSLLARETGGVSRFVTARERVDLPAVDLFASMGQPVASGLKTTGKCAARTSLGGFRRQSSASVWRDQRNSADARSHLGRRPDEHSRYPMGDAQTGQTVRLLQGSRLITDWESRYPAGEALAPLEKRKHNRVAERLSTLSRTYGLASREMSLVAVVKRSGDRPGAIPETRVVPVGMPQDVKFEAYLPAAPLDFTAGFGSVMEAPQAAYTPKPEVRRSFGAGCIAGHVPEIARSGSRFRVPNQRTIFWLISPPNSNPTAECRAEMARNGLLDQSRFCWHLWRLAIPSQLAHSAPTLRDWCNTLRRWAIVRFSMSRSRRRAPERFRRGTGWPSRGIRAYH